MQPNQKWLVESLAEIVHSHVTSSEKWVQFVTCTSFCYHSSRCSYLLLHLFPDFSSLHVGLWRNGSSPGWEPEPEQQPAETGAVQESSQAVAHRIPGGHLEGNDEFDSCSVTEKTCFFCVCLYFLCPSCSGTLDSLIHLRKCVEADVLTLTLAF